MADTAPLTIDLPRDVLEALESISERTGKSMAELAEDALEEYLKLQRRQLAGIVESLAEIDAGAKMCSNEEVMAWLESWETPDELLPPK